MADARFSKLAENYPASGIRKMFNVALQYPDAIKLTVGEPNFDTPDYVKEAAKKAIDDGRTHTVPTQAFLNCVRQLQSAIRNTGMATRRIMSSFLSVLWRA